jgi:hypothetical protein
VAPGSRIDYDSHKQAFLINSQSKARVKKKSTDAFGAVIGLGEMEISEVFWKMVKRKRNEMSGGKR